VKYLVDANVLSEATRPSPDPKVIQWLRDHEREIAIDSIILGEIRFGILLLPKGRRRQRLENWFDAGISMITCLPWDADVGLRWAALLAELRKRGRSMPIKDSMIAATALHHRLTIATRNTGDFPLSTIQVLNPFS
jgi:predicted nucleic acid-binding protein